MFTATRMAMLISFLFLCACTDSSDEHPKGKGEHIFSTQQKALEQAKVTTRLIQEQEERERKQVEEQR